MNRAQAKTRERQDRNFLLGLSALAEHPEFHFGAGIIAVERLKSLLGCSSDERIGIDREIDRYCSGTNSVTLLSRRDMPVEDAIAAVAEALSQVGKELHFIAHDLIISVSALVALQGLDGKVDRRMVSGLSRMILGFSDAPPGIFHGLDGRTVRDLEEGFRDFDPDADEAFLVGRMLSVLKGIAKTGLGFGFRAQEYHVVTHTHALIWLKKNGFGGLFRDCLRPWFFRMSLLDALHRVEERDFKAAPFAEIEMGGATFWKRIGRLAEDPHVFKTALSILELKGYGLLAQEDFRFLVSNKFPYWFSLVDNEFD